MSRQAELELSLLAGAGQARELLCQLLRQARAMDLAGAMRVVKTDPELNRLLQQKTPAASDLLDRMDELAQAGQCIGCATCCRTSSPTLYLEDLRHIYPEGLDKGQLFTLRAGERASSARHGQSLRLETDLIKLREKNRDCTFLRKGRCAAYQHRPLQCRYLQCWDHDPAPALKDLPRLSREHIYAEDPTALDMMREYELKVPAAQLTTALEQVDGGDISAQEKVLALMELDQRLRHAITARYPYPPWELELLLGRPALVVARSYRLAPELDAGKVRLKRF